MSACQAIVLSVVDYSTVGKLDIAREKNVADERKECSMICAVNYGMVKGMSNSILC